jgi:hypothetical protein
MTETNLSIFDSDSQVRRAQAAWRGLGSVALYRRLQDIQDIAFGPAEIEAMVMAYEDACRVLKLTERRSDPLTQILALKIIEIARTGELDPVKMRDIALRGMHLPRD